MKIFRKSYFEKLLILITGAAFLNVGFFLAEVKALKLKDRQLIENIEFIILNAGLEEERDGNETTESDSAKEEQYISLNISNLYHHDLIYQSANRRSRLLDDLVVPQNHQEIFSPPPEA